MQRFTAPSRAHLAQSKTKKNYSRPRARAVIFNMVWLLMGLVQKAMDGRGDRERETEDMTNTHNTTPLKVESVQNGGPYAKSIRKLSP